jgi:hypothetical protein
MIEEILKSEDALMESAWRTQQEKIRSIPGIEIVMAARNEWRAYFEKMRAFLRNDSSGSPPLIPLTDIDALAVQYPKASAFMDALEFSEEPSEAKAVAGDHAMARIIDDEDPATVIREMVVEWKELCGIAHE